MISFSGGKAAGDPSRSSGPARSAKHEEPDPAWRKVPDVAAASQLARHSPHPPDPAWLVTKQLQPLENYVAIYSKMIQPRAHPS